MIVQKFGGIAMKDKKSREICIKHIKEGLAKYKSVIVVVSSNGKSWGSLFHQILLYN